LIDLEHTMKKSMLACLFTAALAFPAIAAEKAAPAPNGITLPADYADWRLIAPAYRADKQHVRAILGNDAAIKAARTGTVQPWPDGAILAKLVWKEQPHEKWPTAMEAGQFVHVEIMVKDARRYAETGGWGYARWIGKDMKPYGKDASFVAECHGCHIPVQDADFVYTKPVKLP
jgi:hypothetical protein